MIYIVLIIAVLVNGATDAANAITGVVSGGALTYRQAALLSAALNFAGLSVFAVFYPAVSETVGSMTVGGEGTALAALMTIVIFAGGAWMFSIPTSESHALVAALAGVGAANGQGIDFPKLIYITLGAFSSALLGAMLGALISKLVPRRKLGNKWIAVAGCAASSFFHGAQDGQKFLALAVATELFDFDMISVMIVAAAMFFGTLLGGKRIVEKLGEKMTRLNMASAVASDIGSALSLFFITVLGIPASTTHTKTCAIAGAAAACGERVDKKELLSIVFGWIITLPACMMLAYFITKAINSL